MKSEPDYDFFAAVRTPEANIKRVRCRLWLPTKLIEEPRLQFLPTERQATGFLGGRFNPYSIRGRVEHSGGSVTTIAADEVWTESVPQRSLDKRRHETVFDGEPWDLRVLERRHLGDTEQDPVRTVTHYLLTPSDELKPLISTWRRRRILRRVSIRLQGGRRIQFESLERHERHEDAHCTFHELAARERRKVSQAVFGVVDFEQLERLDDVLAIVSFASRHRVACLAIDASSEDASRFRFYRRHMGRPPVRMQHRHESMIDLSDFDDFLPVAYTRFVESGPDILVRHALHISVPDRDSTVESRFASTFAAIESLVLWYRRQHDLEFAVTNDDWAVLKRELSTFLKQYPSFTGDKHKRRRGDQVRANLNALQRIPFSTAFGRFCAHFDVSIDDLWPMSGRGQDVGLTAIRNRVVHGSVFDRRQFTALATAGDHLNWILERMLLRVLGWPVDRSDVSAVRLRKLGLAYAELAEARDAIRTVPEPPVYGE